MPCKTLHVKGEACHRGKLSEQRITILLGTNADSSNKMKAIVTDEFQKFLCFKSNTTLPYENKTKESSSLHGYVSSSSTSLTIVLSIPICKSKLQPLDLGIIHSFKRKYRKMLVLKALPSVDWKAMLKLNSLQVVHVLTGAWKAVTAGTEQLETDSIRLALINK
ncbi:hypothetical protein ANN_08847 [Periplaneta americana]|uniref:DDE-1 domain-containing protein n=1 Tax=Periplaneta americana TaxID=6978 RepID=A0ABQ8T2L5_PERAM|nr:hypothetical protein ANN_08847 [Periplaneta americana]